MTDYQTLVGNLRRYSDVGTTTFGITAHKLSAKAAEAIEALQGEVERLNDDCAMHMRVAIKAIDEVVEVKAERDALQAKLDELQKQDADWFHAECDDPDYSGFYQSEADAITQVNEHGGYVTSLYAAPKALEQEPLTDERLIEMENEVARKAGNRRELTIGYARAVIADAIEALQSKLDAANTYAAAVQGRCDDLQAKLDALETQVGENYGVVTGFTDEGLALVDYPCEGNTIDLEEGMLLYAAPKALEPLTRKQIDDLAEEGVYLGNIYEITKEIEAAHGITKGTP